MNLELSVLLVDAAIVLTLAEAAAIALHHRFTGRGLAVGDWAPNLGAGLALMIALRTVVADAGSAWLAAALAAAGSAHAIDLARRLRRAA